MTLEEKAEIVISQLRADRDRLQESLSRCIEIPDGATNEDVIRIMFDVKVEDDFCKSIGIKLNNSNYVQFNKDWLNAPYNPPKQNLAPADKSGLEYAEQPTLQSAT